MSLEQTPFGRTPQGQLVSRFTLTNAAGMIVQVIDFGAAISSVCVPDRNGDAANVTLGFDHLDPYLENPEFLGVVIGPFANRIGGAAFTVDGIRYNLEANEGTCHLHGGSASFSRKLWQAEDVSDDRGPAVAFSIHRLDGEGNYPGNLTVTATYRLTDQNELVLDYEAVTDQATPVNLTNHAYWNLAGAGSGDVLDHELKIFADQYLDMDKALVPTGKFLDVVDGPLDFITSRAIRTRFETAALPGDWTPGYDHAYALQPRAALNLAAVVYEPRSGRVMEVRTTYPGMQLYTGNDLDIVNGAGGCHFDRYGGLALEAQFFPDSVNKPEFPSTILEPNVRYEHTTAHRFSVSTKEREDG